MQTKKPLTSDPFVVEFEYGSNGEGYWNYEAMSMQFEDCIDCIHVLYPMHEVVFLFDHSCGHDRKRPDGLNLNALSKGYGGKQVKMRSSLIKQKEGYLGKYSHQLNILKIGSIQSMVFTEENTGPIYLTDEEKIKKRYDSNTGVVKKEKRKLTELIDALFNEKKISAKGNLKKITDLCTQNNISLTKETSVIDEGWVNKPKGMLQILYERGFLDPTRSMKTYTLDGKKDEYGHVVPETSLKELISSLLDFQNEETLLQYHGRLLGVIVDRTPKCHPEIAGEGIEYSWGAAKLFYRRLRIKEKRSKEKFRNSVKNSTNRNTILTIARQRKFSKRARQYMLAYQAIELQRKRNTDEDIKMSHMLLEKVVKVFKTHRNAADTDTKWIGDVVGSMKKPVVLTEEPIEENQITPSNNGTEVLNIEPTEENKRKQSDNNTKRKSDEDPE